MAALNFAVNSGEIACVAATAKTILQIVAPTNQRVRILEWGVYFDGTSGSAEPVQVTLSRQSSAGSGSSSVTPTKDDDSIGDSIQTTAIKGCTSEPTTGDTLRHKNVHPQGGYEWNATPGQDLICGAGDRIGIVVTAPANVNAIGFMRCEE